MTQPIMVLGITALGVFGGCSKDSDPAKVGSSAPEGASNHTALQLLYSNNLDGEIEPCG